MATTNPYSSFVYRACAARTRLINKGASKVPVLKSHKDVDSLKKWLQFYGHVGNDKVKAWFFRELATIEAVMPPNFQKQLEKLLTDEEN